MRHPYLFCLFVLVAGAVQAQDPTYPTPAPLYTSITENLTDYDVILQPDEAKPEWWAGAPSVARGPDGTFWLAARMRTAESERGLRGYEIRILKSADGVHFEKVHNIRREDVPIPGFERPALLFHDGMFKLYACGPWQGGPWGIIKFDDAPSPDQFDPATAKLVVAPPEKTYDRDVAVVEYKDPFILFAGGQFHCYVTGYMRRNERIYHFTSPDGETWTPAGNPYTSLLPLSGWHDFFVRPACVVPVGVGYLFVYEGSSAAWYDPVYNVATGLAFTFDLHTLTDLTPDAPLLVSQTPGPHFATFRYAHWLRIDDELYIYAEVAAPNETNELRLYRLPLN